MIAALMFGGILAQFWISESRQAASLSFLAFAALMSKICGLVRRQVGAMGGRWGSRRQAGPASMNPGAPAGTRLPKYLATPVARDHGDFLLIHQSALNTFKAKDLRRDERYDSTMVRCCGACLSQCQPYFG